MAGSSTTSLPARRRAAGSYDATFIFFVVFGFVAFGFELPGFTPFDFVVFGFVDLVVFEGVDFFVFVAVAAVVPRRRLAGTTRSRPLRLAW